MFNLLLLKLKESVFAFVYLNLNSKQKIHSIESDYLIKAVTSEGGFICAIQIVQWNNNNIVQKISDK